MITPISKIKLALSKITGLGSNVATFLATPSSANLASALTDETGSGSAVFATAPTITGATIKNMVDEILTTGGTSTAYTLTPSVAIGSYVTGQRFQVKFNVTCGASPTINISGLGAKNLTKGGATALSASDVMIDGLYTVEYDGTQLQVIGISSSSGSTAATRAEIATGTNNTLMATPQNLHEFHVPPQGFLYNGKIVPSVASNNLTVALKGLDGNDPSASNPVYVRIGDTVRTITAALSVTKNAGTNWFNAGYSILATIEVDYFVYLGYNATDGVVIGFSRLAGGKYYSSFSTTSTDDRYCAISTITTASSGDYYELVGRFAATLSATASFNWSVPSFNGLNLIQGPKRESRWLTWSPVMTYTGTEGTGGSQRARYKLIDDTVFINYWKNYSAGGATVTKTSITLPFGILTPYSSQYTPFAGYANVGSTNNIKYTQFDATGGANNGSMNWYITSCSLDQFAGAGSYELVVQ